MSELLCCLASGGSIKKNDSMKWWLYNDVMLSKIVKFYDSENQNF